MTNTPQPSIADLAEKIEGIRRDRAAWAANIPTAEKRLQDALISVETTPPESDEHDAAAAELTAARENLDYWQKAVREADLTIAGLRETLRQRQAEQAAAAKAAAMAEVRELSRQRQVQYDDIEAAMQTVGARYEKMLAIERALAHALKRAGLNTSHLDGRRAGIGVQSLAFQTFGAKLCGALEIPGVHRRLDPVRAWRDLFTYHLESSPEGDNAEAA